MMRLVARLAAAGLLGAVVLVPQSVNATGLIPRAVQASGMTPTLVATFGGPGHASIYPSGMEVAPDGTIVAADTATTRSSSTAPLAPRFGVF